MHVRIIRITTRRSGAQARKETRLEVGSLSVGRGTDNEVVLNDLTLPLSLASFEFRPDGVYVLARSESEVRLDGAGVRSERVEPGSSIRAGSFELRVVEPSEGEDLALEVEAVVQRGNERDELDKRTLRGIEGGVTSRRLLSYTLAAVVALACLALPFALDDAQTFWSSGEIARKHAVVANDCSACHEAFTRAPDHKCLRCHSGIGSHTPQLAATAQLDATRCASCHVEHNGETGLADTRQTLCTDCHADIRSVHPDTGLENAGDFAGEHPELKLAMLDARDDGRPVRTSWSASGEASGVLFSHSRHVAEPVDGPGRDRANLQCGECHVRDAGGFAMQPVHFEAHCQSCHSLEYDPDLPGVQALHGDPQETRKDILERYAALALEGRLRGEGEPEFLAFVIPGQKISDRESRELYAWLRGRVVRANELLFDPESQRCALCHQLEGRADDGMTDIAPVAVTRHWMPLARFSHETHGPFTCASCHAAAAVFDAEASGERPQWSLPDAIPYALLMPDELAQRGLEPSRESSDVLVPGIAVCRDCHGGAAASPPLVKSGCVLCHGFHGEHETLKERRAASPRRTHAGDRTLEVGLLGLGSGGSAR